MKTYKPVSLEENYSNVQRLQGIFWGYIQAYIWEYRNIVDKYENPYRYNQLLMINAINPYLNGYEAEMGCLAYGIYGFTSNVFETLAYALDCWRIQTDNKQKNRDITNKQYDQALDLLTKKKKISGSDKETLLGFRKARNYYVHSGRMQFCRFIFDNGTVLYNLISVITELLGGMNMNPNLILEFDYQQGDCIEEMKEVLENFAIDNCITA